MVDHQKSLPSVLTFSLPIRILHFLQGTFWDFLSQTLGWVTTLLADSISWGLWSGGRSRLHLFRVNSSHTLSSRLSLIQSFFHPPQPWVVGVGVVYFYFWAGEEGRSSSCQCTPQVRGLWCRPPSVLAILQIYFKQCSGAFIVIEDSLMRHPPLIFHFGLQFQFYMICCSS